MVYDDGVCEMTFDGCWDPVKYMSCISVCSAMITSSDTCEFGLEIFSAESECWTCAEAIYMGEEECVPAVCGCSPGFDTIETVDESGCVTSCECVEVTEPPCEPVVCDCAPGFTTIESVDESGCVTDCECVDECVCIEIWDPVCADGTTYSNECTAGCDGHTEFTAGECFECPIYSCPTEEDCPFGVTSGIDENDCFYCGCAETECTVETARENMICPVAMCLDPVCDMGYEGVFMDKLMEGDICCLEPCYYECVEVEPVECDGMTAGQYDCVCPSGFVKEATYIGERRKLAIWGELPYCGENACMFYQEAPDMMVGGVGLTNECYNYVEDYTYEVHSVIGEEELDEAYHQDGCDMFTFACVEESPEDLPVCDAGPYPEEAVGGEAMCCFYHAWFMMLNNCQFKETEECPESHEYACTMPEPIEPSEEECVCIEMYNPVCVQGDKEYSNSCYAECDGYMEYEVGVCEVDGECTDVIVNVGAYPSEISWTIVGESFSCESPSYDSALQNSELPHPCCVDKSDTVVLTCSDSYGDSFNGGYIEVHGEIYCDGEFGSEETIILGGEIEDSTEICICSMEYNPVCVGGDQEYSNPCLAECDGYMEYDLGVCEEVCICYMEYDLGVCEE